MCGQIRMDSERTLTERTPAEKVLFALGDVVEEYGPLAVGLLLLRCRRPRNSCRDLARTLGISSAGGYRLYRRILYSNPELARYIRGAAKTRGMSGGRKYAGGRKPVGEP